MIQTIVPIVIGVGCLVLMGGLLAFLRDDRLVQRGRVFTDRELFESGKDAAEKKRIDHDRRVRKGTKGVEREEHVQDTPLARRLRAAGIGIAVLPWLACVIGITLLAGVAVGVVSGYIVAGMVAAVCVPAFARAFLVRRERARRTLFDTQLSRALPQIAASVRGSLTLERALRVASVHMEDPLRSEFMRVLADTAYGVPLHEALERMAYRTQNLDMKTLAAATKIRQSRGGSMGASLSMIATRVNARLKAARELKVEIASVKMAKWFVAAAMPAIFLIMYVSNADFARFYTSDPLGWAVLGMAALFETVGLFISQRITTLDR